MKPFHLIISLTSIGLLVWLNREFVPADAATFGGLTIFGWASIAFVGVGIGFIVIANDLARAFGFFRQRDERAAAPLSVRTLDESELAELRLDKYRGPAYPHPIIFPDRCIGCHACVDACPHDVLAIVDGIAAATAPDLCMEDTACQAECPVNPKACIVINTAKEVRSLPTPARDGASFETNVPGCYIIGDVSGVPLIKNAVKEGADVIRHLAAELKTSSTETRAEYDVAIIGVGPGGASAAVTASDAGLRYVAIEQDKVLSTIDLYPKGKYIFFKPDTRDWSGGITVAGLGLDKSGKADTGGDHGKVIEAIRDVASNDILPLSKRLHGELIGKIPRPLHAELAKPLFLKIQSEILKRVAAVLPGTASDCREAYAAQFVSSKERYFEQFAAEISDELTARIPGGQRESILELWHQNLAEKTIKVNENESCRSVKRAADGDYFIVVTERGAEKSTQTYTARKVVIAVGLRGAPNKLRLANEDLKLKMEGRERPKVLYGLSNPAEFWGCRIVIVGGGNAAVEAAVDLVANRDGSSITPRPPEFINNVTLLIRDALAPTVKFGNKFQLYKCADEGLIDLRFGFGIKELREHDVILENLRNKAETQIIPNDFVFAMIGGERPNRFLESIGINIK